ncbi:Protein of unknown function [Alteromonadaceae bacterium Bs31]|nr:Protein of unknown function [Alteromonadaceae bacterium Bs31]
MFAIFFSEKMDPFYEICSSFPTVVFTVLLIFCILYWALAVLGMVEIDILDFDIPEDIDINNFDDMSNLNVMSGLLLKLGLNAVPLTIVLTLIALLGWVISFLIVYFLFPFVPGALLKFLVAIPVFIGTAYVSAMITATVIRPLRPIFQAANQEVEKTIVGQVAIVRTGRVDKKFGEATVEDGGAGLLVKVRPYKEEQFKRGDRVVLLEYIAEENLYKVVSESDFKGE